jgi:hypothetical protein
MTDPSAGPETTGRKQDGTFAPGVSGNPAGRPRGSRNKLAEDFFRALAEDFATHGAAAIISMRDEKPNEYAKMVAGLMTKEVDATVSEETYEERLRRVAGGR